MQKSFRRIAPLGLRSGACVPPTAGLRPPTLRIVLAVAGVPLETAKFAGVFHGPAVDGILNNAHYKAKFGADNPNFKAIAEMKKKDVGFHVCGRYLAGEKIDPKP